MNLKIPANHRHFSSISEFVSFANAPLTRQDNSASRASHLTRENVKWLGVPTIAEAEKCFAEGWQSGAEKVEELYTRLAPRLPRAISVKRQRSRSDQGDALDIHAVYRGDLSRAWETTSRNLRHGTALVRIVADICGNAGTRSDALALRGLAALALHRILNRAGYSTEIVAAIGGRNEADSSEKIRVSLLTVTVKPRHAHVDSATLASVVMLSGFFRRIGFSAIVAHCDSRNVAVASGLGQAATAESIIAGDSRVTQIVTPEFRDVAHVEQWLADTIKLFGMSTLTAEGGR